MKSQGEDMLNVVVVYKTGGDFCSDDVCALCAQIARNLTIPYRFVCLTDDHFECEGMDILPLKHGYPGWWSIMETFRIKEPVLFMGLDTVIFDNIDRAGELALSCPADTIYMTRPQKTPRNRGEKYCSGVMIWNGDWSWIYDQFKVNPKKYMRFYRGEQKFTSKQLILANSKVRLFQEHFTGFYSYKNECPDGQPPQDATIIAFHGKPRPKDCEEEWVAEILADRSTPVHPWSKIAEDKDVS